MKTTSADSCQVETPLARQLELLLILFPSATQYSASRRTFTRHGQTGGTTLPDAVVNSPPGFGGPVQVRQIEISKSDFFAS
ncbi:MAG: hypothetical protein P4M14_01360 [Gammaproteobacteria bacterium]|nr:hypothetical protein [Gammaproteobacteria bacterium]